MTGQKIKLYKKNFKDISLSQKLRNYSGLIKKKSNNIFNLRISIYPDILPVGITNFYTLRL
jgi:hypothetical protein